MTVSELTERELVARLQKQLAPAPDWVVVGIGDDAAVVEPERNQLDVFTVDALVEGVHFDRRFTPPDAIGHRALAVNLSDLAAMGARSRAALLSFALPHDLLVAEFDALVGGITRLAARARMEIVGGNLTRSPGPLMIDVTAIGTVGRRRVLTRGGASPDDELYVTGFIGSAAAGLQVLQTEDHLPEASMEACVLRYLYPEPRLRAGLLIGRNRGASACVDLSDGLADAIRQIATSSGVGVTIEGPAVPIDPAAKTWFEQRGLDPVLAAATGGDDYELLFAVPRKLRSRFFGAVRASGTPVTRIGLCTPDGALQIQGTTSEGALMTKLPHGFSHFR